MTKDEYKATDQLNLNESLFWANWVKNKVIDDLEEGHILVTHNVACFYFIQKETNYLLEISDRNFKLLVVN